VPGTATDTDKQTCFFQQQQQLSRRRRRRLLWTLYEAKLLLLELESRGLMLNLVWAVVKEEKNEKK